MSFDLTVLTGHTLESSHMAALGEFFKAQGFQVVLPAAVPETSFELRVLAIPPWLATYGALGDEAGDGGTIVNMDLYKESSDDEPDPEFKPPNGYGTTTSAGRTILEFAMQVYLSAGVAVVLDGELEDPQEGNTYRGANEIVEYARSAVEEYASFEVPSAGEQE